MECLLFGASRNLAGMTRVLISNPPPAASYAPSHQACPLLTSPACSHVRRHPPPHPPVSVHARPAAADYHAVRQPAERTLFFFPSSGRLPALRHRARKGDCRLAGHPIIFRAASPAALPAEVRPVRSFQALLIGGDGNRGEQPDSGACLPAAWALDPSSSAGQIQIDWM